MQLQLQYVWIRSLITFCHHEEVLLHDLLGKDFEQQFAGLRLFGLLKFVSCSVRDAMSKNKHKMKAGS